MNAKNLDVNFRDLIDREYNIPEQSVEILLK